MHACKHNYMNLWSARLYWPYDLSARSPVQKSC
jgi:hypothetical protein